MIVIDAGAALFKHPDIDPLDRERRFLPTNAQVDAFIEAVTVGALFGVNELSKPATTTWTTYLDTEDLLYFHSCDGPVARRLRVREYETKDADAVAAGALAPASPCYLELKETMRTNRSKVRLAAPVAMLARLIEGTGDIDSVLTNRETQAVALLAIKEALAQGRFAPCVGTSYQRRCLAAGPNLRVTLDANLTFFHPVSLGAPRENREAVAVGPAWVLEVKYGGAMPDWLVRALEGLNEVPEFSKFRLGMLAVQQAAQMATVLPASDFHAVPFNNSIDAALCTAAAAHPVA